MSFLPPSTSWSDVVIALIELPQSFLAGAVISNHCSYFDILILMSRYFPSFVARSNTQDMPLIGVCRYLYISLQWPPILNDCMCSHIGN